MHEHALITGGCGFVGSFLAIALREAGLCRNVTALDNLHRRGSELNLARLKRAGVGFVHGDIRCAEDLAPFAGAADLVVECSAEPSAQAGYGSSPEYLIQSNLTGCFHCLEIARRSKADFLFLSTSRVYPYRLLNSLSFEETDTRFRLTARQELPGASEHGVSERFPLDGARSLYGMTKLAAELMGAKKAIDLSRVRQLKGKQQQLKQSERKSCRGRKKPPSRNGPCIAVCLRETRRFGDIIWLCNACFHRSQAFVRYAISAPSLRSE